MLKSWKAVVKQLRSDCQAIASSSYAFPLSFYCSPVASQSLFHCSPIAPRLLSIVSRSFAYCFSIAFPLFLYRFPEIAYLHCQVLCFVDIFVQLFLVNEIQISCYFKLTRKFHQRSISHIHEVNLLFHTESTITFCDIRWDRNGSSIHLLTKSIFLFSREISGNCITTNNQLLRQPINLQTLKPKAALMIFQLPLQCFPIVSPSFPYCLTIALRCFPIALLSLSHASLSLPYCLTIALLLLPHFFVVRIRLTCIKHFIRPEEGDHFGVPYVFYGVCVSRGDVYYFDFFSRDFVGDYFVA